MRHNACVTFVTGQVRALFEADVAEALLSDDEVFENVARLLNNDHGTTDAITSALSRVAKALSDDDGLADWLVDHDDAAGKWLYCRIREL